MTCKDLGAPGAYEYIKIEDLEEIVDSYSKLLNKPINRQSAGSWYALANGCRHLFDNQVATAFAEKIYKKIVCGWTVPDFQKSMSYRCLSKIAWRNNKVDDALTYALKAEKSGKETDKTFGKTLRYIGDLYSIGFENTTEGCKWYLESLRWC